MGVPASRITSKVFRAHRGSLPVHGDTKRESTEVLNNSTRRNATGRQPTMLQNRRLSQLTVRHFRLPLSWLFWDVTQCVDSWLPTLRDSFSVTPPRTQQSKEARVSQSVWTIRVRIPVEDMRFSRMSRPVLEPTQRCSSD
jgi:hypothetical protein